MNSTAESTVADALENLLNTTFGTLEHVKEWHAAVKTLEAYRKELPADTSDLKFLRDQEARVIEILIAAGLISQQKVDQARSLVLSLSGTSSDVSDIDANAKSYALRYWPEDESKQAAARLGFRAGFQIGSRNYWSTKKLESDK